MSEEQIEALHKDIEEMTIKGAEIAKKLDPVIIGLPVDAVTYAFYVHLYSSLKNYDKIDYFLHKASQVFREVQRQQLTSRNGESAHCMGEKLSNCDNDDRQLLLFELKQDRQNNSI
jgi:hypothetical protein